MARRSRDNGRSKGKPVPDASKIFFDSKRVPRQSRALVLNLHEEGIAQHVKESLYFKLMIYTEDVMIGNIALKDDYLTSKSRESIVIELLFVIFHMAAGWSSSQNTVVDH